MVWRTALVISSAIFLVSIGVCRVQDTTAGDYDLRRRLNGINDNQQAIPLPYNLPSSARDWCLPPSVPPLDYTQCNPNGIVNEIPFLAGLTNGLKMLLLGVISSFEDNRCFTIDESRNELINRDSSENTLDSLLLRYFEPMGLPRNHSIVVQAQNGGGQRLQRQKWNKVWGSVASLQKRRVYKRMSTIFNLGYEDMEGHELKKTMLQRMWRPLPQVRHNACSSMEQLGLHSDYMAFSVRRGDKTLERVQYTPLEKYIQAAERATAQFFGDVVPTIFVASDDCSVLPRFRELRSAWNFVSECDTAENLQGIGGYHLSDMKSWTKEETDAHYRKFFVEVFALAAAKYFIGVSHTNVSWWVFFMRPNRWSYELIDTDRSTNSIIDKW